VLADRQSKFKFYSLGIVLEDKFSGSWDITVTPIEDIANLEMPLIRYKPTYDVSLPDAQGVTRQSKVEGRAWITARWLPLSQSNRITAPDVIKNETVLLYRFADSETYYWDTIFHEPHIRRLEHVIHAYGNKTEPLDPWNEDTSYTVKISTRDKVIHLKTVDNDGEKAAYDIIIDTQGGSILVKDNLGNLVKLVSPEMAIEVETLEKITLKSKLITLDAPEVVVTGNLSIGGALSVGGGMTVSGKMVVGDIEVKGKLKYS